MISTRVDAFERHRNIHVVVAGLRVVQPLPVEQDQGLAEAGAADREVGLNAVGRARGKVERGVQLQDVDQCVEHRATATHRQHTDRAIDLFERQRFVGAGDDDGFAEAPAPAVRKPGG